MESIQNSMKPTSRAEVNLSYELYGEDITDIAITIGNYMTDDDMQLILTAIDNNTLYECLHTLYYLNKEENVI